MALNTASDSPGDTIIPYYYVLVYFMRRTNTRRTLILLGTPSIVFVSQRITNRRFC